MSIKMHPRFKSLQKIPLAVRGRLPNKKAAGAAEKISNIAFKEDSIKIYG